MNRALKRILKRTVGHHGNTWAEKLDDALWAFRIAYKNPLETGRYRKMQMNELAELRDQEYKTYYIYKERIKLLHDAKLIPTNFSPGDKVLLFKSCFKRFFGKFKSRWIGPFTVIHVFPHGAVELEGPTNFKVNGHRLKVYLEDHTREEDPLSLEPP
ncbi:uncharacterized protein [Rutidosis leptorrhynchoides]|uniref:uncharacterized protein n=1 Tax=Rutidosis leptorrhynchoides TaxID=125765 RepID=UPI003A98D618